MADTPANNTPTLTGQPLLQSLLTSGKYANPQDAVDAYNVQTYGNKVTGRGDKGYGDSPEYYANSGMIGGNGYYMVPDGKGGYQTTQRPSNQQLAKSKPLNLPPASPLFGAAGATAGAASQAPVSTQPAINTAMPAQTPLQGSLNVNDMQRAINARLLGQQ